MLYAQSTSTVISGRMVSQAPQHFKLSEKQTTCGGCFSRKYVAIKTRSARKNNLTYTLSSQDLFPFFLFFFLFNFSPTRTLLILSPLTCLRDKGLLQELRVCLRVLWRLFLRDCLQPTPLPVAPVLSPNGGLRGSRHRLWPVKRGSKLEQNDA